MNDLTRILENSKLVPVVGIPSVESALGLSKLLLRCRLPVIEVTFRTSFAERGIREIVKNFPDMHVLAGTVLSLDQAEAAYDSGCRAIVSPGFSCKIAEFCRARKLPYLPGVCTPTEIHTALDAGLNLLKFFPAEHAGGVKFSQRFRPYSSRYGSCRPAESVPATWSITSNRKMSCAAEVPGCARKKCLLKANGVRLRGVCVQHWSLSVDHVCCFPN